MVVFKVFDRKTEEWTDMSLIQGQTKFIGGGHSGSDYASYYRDDYEFKGEHVVLTRTDWGFENDEPFETETRLICHVDDLNSVPLQWNGNDIMTPDWAGCVPVEA